ncbi:Uncharacterised protein [Actinomyces howellii]|uniref:Uncharacterized protein n=1 Tax=Actinomyces howellii TaxID=52771 RepID=A0A448HG55_9ACTO|nr:Uncharacterised protein [Actinomyces howellii]
MIHVSRNSLYLASAGDSTFTLNKSATYFVDGSTLLVLSQMGRKTVRGRGVDTALDQLMSMGLSEGTLSFESAPEPAEVRPGALRQFAEQLVLAGLLVRNDGHSTRNNNGPTSVVFGRHSSGCGDVFVDLLQKHFRQHCGAREVRYRLVSTLESFEGFSIQVNYSDGSQIKGVGYLSDNDLWIVRTSNSSVSLEHLQNASHYCREDGRVDGNRGDSDRVIGAWSSWLANYFVYRPRSRSTNVYGVPECWRLRTDTEIKAERHNLVQLSIDASDNAGNSVRAPADPLYPYLIDPVTSAIGSPQETNLSQVPLSLSSCRVRTSNSICAYYGYGWTLDESRRSSIDAALSALAARAPEGGGIYPIDLEPSELCDLNTSQTIQRAGFVNSRLNRMVEWDNELLPEALVVTLYGTDLIAYARSHLYSTTLPSSIVGADLLRSRVSELDIYLRSYGKLAIAVIDAGTNYSVVAVSDDGAHDALELCTFRALCLRQAMNAGISLTQTGVIPRESATSVADFPRHSIRSWDVVYRSYGDSPFASVRVYEWQAQA